MVCVFKSIPCTFSETEGNREIYCGLKARLVIELDGGGHYEPEQASKDAFRTAELNEMKRNVVRICNLDIDRNFRGVCEYMDRIVQQSMQ